MFKAGSHVVHFCFGLLLFPFVYVFVSGTNVENHYLAALAIYAPLAVLFAFCVRHRCQPSKELVDFVYYFTGVVSVVLEPPPKKWSDPMIRKRRTIDGDEETQARRDCLEVTAS